MLARIAAVLGREDDRRRLAERHRQAAASFQRVCFEAARGVYVDGEGSRHASLHANMVPAAAGLVPPEHQASVTAFIRSRGMACSVFGAHYLLEALYRLGEAEYALALMTAEHDRGWLHMLELGSTITLEAWDVRYKDNLDWNHAWGAAPANIIPRRLVGVRPATPGFREILVAPQPAGLEWVRAKVPTRGGPVSVEIEQQPAAALSVPPGSTARVDLSHLLQPETRLSVDGATETVASLRGRALPGGEHHLRQ